jgi:2-dehydro-3-deoxygluconokinase
MPYANLIIATESDARMVLDDDAGLLDRSTILVRLYETYDPDAVVITCGSEGSLGYGGPVAWGRGILRSPGHTVEVVNRIGAGDAYDAGLLYGYLTQGLQAGLDCGGAMAALKMTIPQNLPLIDPRDVQRLLSGVDVDLVR